MAECIVHLLKPIEIDQHDCTWPLLRLERGQRSLQHFRHAIPVKQAGQRIVSRQPRGVVGRAALRRNVDAAAPITGEAAVIVELRLPRYCPPAFVFKPGRPDCQLVEFRLFDQHERKCALTATFGIRSAEQFDERPTE